LSYSQVRAIKASEKESEKAQIRKSPTCHGR
jgi:hypothetical protein